jgi:hypothetical protein
LWYGGQGKDGHDRISYAESREGKKWVRKGVVLKDDKANHVNDPYVVKVNGRYFMFFTRAGKDVVDRIDLATSSDGRQWEPQGMVVGPGTEGFWDSLSVGRPAVIYEDGLFKMWYDGRKDFPPGSPVQGVPQSARSQRWVGYATSRDGLTWQRHPANPVFGHDAGGVDVKRIGKKLILLYESREGTRLAKSDHGIKWQDVGLLVKKAGRPVDAFGHVTPFLLLDAEKGVHYLYVGAARAASWDRNQIAVIPLPERDLAWLLNGDR